jgi:ElaB/YqjD/DUF883 family membrane-anchored ribosome-binding protein
MAAGESKGQSMEARPADEIQRSTEKLLQDLKAVVQDGEALLKAGAQDLSERATAAREKLAAALEKAKETRQRLEERACEGAKTADRLVRQYPYQSIGLAFGVGVVIGVLLNRK